MDSIENTVSAYFDAFNRSDVNGIVSLFTEDGAVMADEMETATGQEQIRRIFEGAFKVMSYQFEFDIDRVLEESNMATVQAHATGTITTLSTNSTITALLHRELFCLRKTGTGWLITDYMFNRA